MHIMQVLDNEEMINFVEGFGEINERHNNSMRFEFVNRGVDEVKKADEVMRS